MPFHTIKHRTPDLPCGDWKSTKNISSQIVNFTVSYHNRKVSDHLEQIQTGGPEASDLTLFAKTLPSPIATQPAQIDQETGQLGHE